MRGNFNSLSVIVLWLMALVASAQDRYVVHFKDKAGTQYSVSDPQKFLSARAIARRVKQEIPISDLDFPVNTTYVQQVAGAGAKVYFTSRWKNCALVQADGTAINTVKGLSFVKSVEYVAPGPRLNGRTKATRKKNQPAIAEATKTQLQMVGINLMQEEDLLGQGVHVAIFDSGFDGVDQTEPFSHLFKDGQILSARDFVTNSTDVYRFDDHGTEVLSVIAANSASYTGGAYEAMFHLFVTEDVSSEYRIEEYNWLFAAEKADSAGVDVISSSLGYNTFDDGKMDYNKATDLDGKTAVISFAAAGALARGIAVVCSAGNEGNLLWGLVTPPADVDGIISVGAVSSAGTRSGFSSKGPTSDGRIKPDLMALGSPASVVRANGSGGFTSGTSVAAPIVTSLLVGLIQRFPDISPKKIVQALLSTASQASAPDNLMGYGIPDFTRAKTSLEGLLPLDEISIYPNPTDTGTFSVRFKNTGLQAKVTVYDLSGRILSQHSISVTASNNPVVIDMSELPAKTYLVKVETTDNFKTFKLIKL